MQCVTKGKTLSSKRLLISQRMELTVGISFNAAQYAFNYYIWASFCDKYVILVVDLIGLSG